MSVLRILILIFLFFSSFLIITSGAQAVGFAKLPDIAKQQKLEKNYNVIKVRRGVSIPRFIPIPIVIPGGRNANTLLWLGVIVVAVVGFKHLRKGGEIDDDETHQASGRNYSANQQFEENNNVDQAIEAMLKSRQRETTSNEFTRSTPAGNAKPVFGKRNG